MINSWWDLFYLLLYIVKRKTVCKIEMSDSFLLGLFLLSLKYCKLSYIFSDSCLSLIWKKRLLSHALNICESVVMSDLYQSIKNFTIGRISGPSECSPSTRLADLAENNAVISRLYRGHFTVISWLSCSYLAVCGKPQNPRANHDWRKTRPNPQFTTAPGYLNTWPAAARTARNYGRTNDF